MPKKMENLQLENLKNLVRNLKILCTKDKKINNNIT